MASIYKLFVLLLLVCPLAINAQEDTLIFKDFQDQQIDPDVISFPEGTEENWVNFDEDFFEDANSRPQDWYISVDQAQLVLSDSIAPADTNFVLSSSSWLQGFLDGNRNWLMTPPIEIVDDQATFHWKSAPFQGPRYCDGYSVLVSTGGNFPSDYTDTLFRAQQMVPPLPSGAADPEANAFNVDSFLFAPAGGYLHADRFTLTDFFTLADSVDNFYTCLLEPHSVSLSAYEGETIRITIVHDSDDDNLIFVDDLLLLGTDPSSSVKAAPADDIRLVTYPNPVTNFLNMLFRLDRPAQVSLTLFDQSGRQLKSIAATEYASGEHSLRLNVNAMPAGAYSLVLYVDGVAYTRQIIK